MLESYKISFIIGINMKQLVIFTAITASFLSFNVNAFDFDTMFDDAVKIVSDDTTEVKKSFSDESKNDKKESEKVTSKKEETDAKNKEVK